MDIIFDPFGKIQTAGKIQMKLLIILLLTFSLLSMTAAETYLFGTAANPEKAEVSEKDGCYQVICTFRSEGSHRRNEDLNELKARKICLLGIASYRKGKKVRRCSATVQGMTLLKKPKSSGNGLIYVYLVPVDGFAEKEVQ